MVIEIATTHRVYRKERLQDFVATSQEEAEEYAKKYAGRVTPEDLKVEQTGKTWSVFVGQWNVVAEFKREGLAVGWMEALAEEGANAEELRTVERNSRAETLLRNYGVLLLPKT